MFIIKTLCSSRKVGAKYQQKSLQSRIVFDLVKNPPPLHNAMNEKGTYGSKLTFTFEQIMLQSFHLGCSLVVYRKVVNKHPQLFPDSLLRGNLWLIYCDLLSKFWLAKILLVDKLTLLHRYNEKSKQYSKIKRQFN